jgi:hypothetical protein
MPFYAVEPCLTQHTILDCCVICATLQVNQAVTAIEAAWKAGIKRQRIELLLPLIGATDLDDWPGGIRQQFKAAAPLVEGILKQLKQKEGLEGRLGVDIWDQVSEQAGWLHLGLAAKQEVVRQSNITVPAVCEPAVAPSYRWRARILPADGGVTLQGHAGCIQSALYKSTY